MKSAFTDWPKVIDGEHVLAGRGSTPIGQKISLHPFSHALFGSHLANHSLGISRKWKVRRRESSTRALVCVCEGRGGVSVYVCVRVCVCACVSTEDIGFFPVK